MNRESPDSNASGPQPTWLFAVAGLVVLLLILLFGVQTIESTTNPQPNRPASAAYEELQRLSTECRLPRGVTYAGTIYAAVDQVDGCDIDTTSDLAAKYPLIGYSCETFYPPNWDGPRAEYLPSGTGRCTLPDNVECETPAVSQLLLSPKTGDIVKKSESIWWSHDSHTLEAPPHESLTGSSYRHDADRNFGDSLETIYYIRVGISSADGPWIGQRGGDNDFVYYHPEIGDRIHGTAGDWAVVQQDNRLQRIDINTGTLEWFADDIGGVSMDGAGLFT